MAQQIFNIAYISTFIQQVGSKAMTQAMYAYFLFYASPAFCIIKYLLHGAGRVGSASLF